MFETMERDSPRRAFIKDDLPTFGRPIMEKVIASSYTTSSFFGRTLTILSRMSPIPIPCSPDVGIGSPNPSE